MSGVLVAIGLLALARPHRARAERGGALATLGLWLVGTPLLDVAMRGPWPAAAAFALAAGVATVRRVPTVAWTLAALVAVSGALSMPLEPGRAWTGAFAVPAGLFVRSPLLWVGLIGAGLAGRAHAAVSTGGALALVLAASTPAPAASPLLAVALGALYGGFRAAVTAMAAGLRRRPVTALLAAGAALTLWNLLSMESYRRWLVPRDDTVAFSDLASHNAAVLRSLVGTPLAFPANAFFALRHDVSAARWDRLATAFVFEPWPGLGHEIALAEAGHEVDGLLDGGWGSRVPCPPVLCRNLAAEAVVYFQLRRATRLSFSIEARGPGEIEVALDGLALGRVSLDQSLARHPLRLQAPVPAGLRRLTLRPLGDSRPRVARIVFATEVP